MCVCVCANLRHVCDDNDDDACEYWWSTNQSSRTFEWRGHWWQERYYCYCCSCSWGSSWPFWAFCSAVQHRPRHSDSSLRPGATSHSRAFFSFSSYSHQDNVIYWLSCCCVFFCNCFIFVFIYKYNYKWKKVVLFGELSVGLLRSKWMTTCAGQSCVRQRRVIFEKKKAMTFSVVRCLASLAVVQCNLSERKDR